MFQIAAPWSNKASVKWRNTDSSLSFSTKQLAGHKQDPSPFSFSLSGKHEDWPWAPHKGFLAVNTDSLAECQGENPRIRLWSLLQEAWKVEDGSTFHSFGGLEALLSLVLAGFSNTRFIDSPVPMYCCPWADNFSSMIIQAPLYSLILASWPAELTVYHWAWAFVEKPCNRWSSTSIQDSSISRKGWRGERVCPKSHHGSVLGLGLCPGSQIPGSRILEDTVPISNDSATSC